MLLSAKVKTLAMANCIRHSCGPIMCENNVLEKSNTVYAAAADSCAVVHDLLPYKLLIDIIGKALMKYSRDSVGEVV